MNGETAQSDLFCIAHSACVQDGDAKEGKMSLKDSQYVRPH